MLLTLRLLHRLWFYLIRFFFKKMSALNFFFLLYLSKAHTALFASHTLLITLSNEEEIRDSHHVLSQIQKNFSTALTGKGKIRDLVLVYPWLPWLYCCLSCAADAIKVLREKWVGKGCNCQRKHHMQVLSGWTGCRNWPGNSQSDSNLFYKDLISCHWTAPGMCTDIVYEFSN